MVEEIELDAIDKAIIEQALIEWQKSNMRPNGWDGDDYITPQRLRLILEKALRRRAIGRTT